MKSSSQELYTNQKSLKLFLLNELFKKSKKIRGKFSPISELIDNKAKIMKIMKLYDLGNVIKNFYMFIVKNYSKQPKERYFLAVILASQSSDLLVNLAKDFAQKNSLKLIQYAIDSNLSRISLISLKEIEKVEDYSISIDILNECRNNFLNTLSKIKNLVK